MTVVGKLRLFVDGRLSLHLTIADREFTHIFDDCQPRAAEIADVMKWCVTHFDVVGWKPVRFFNQFIIAYEAIFIR